MSAPVIILADAVAVALAAASFSEEFAPQRKYTPRVDLKNADSLSVFVVPKSAESTLISRKSTEDTLKVDVGFIQRIADDARADTLMGLVADVAEWFRMRKLDGFDGDWLETATDPIFLPDHLAEKKQFTAVITLTYGLTRGT